VLVSPHNPPVSDESPLNRILAALGLVVAGVILVALSVQILEQVARGTFRAENYFWFFSIQSSLANIVVLGIGGIFGLTRHPAPHSLVVARGAVVTYAVLTLAVYHALLLNLVSGSTVANPLTQWPLEVVHVWVPIYLVLEWVLRNQRITLRWWFVMVGVAYPAIWFAATLIRGGLTGWYPYPFLDPAGPDGWVGVGATTALIGAAALGVLALVFAFNRLQQRVVIGASKTL
jgi:hypothetical protein